MRRATAFMRVTRLILLPVILGTASAQLPAASYVVTTTLDSGPGSLRQQVSSANANPGPDTVLFQEGLGTITLTGGQIDITDSLSIVGNAAYQHISGNDNSRIFAKLATEAALSISNVTLTNGYAERTTGNDIPCLADAAGGGAVCVHGDIQLQNCEISGSTDTGNVGGGGSGGGALHVYQGSATINNCRFTDNTATNNGGAISVFIGNLALDRSVVSGNTAREGGGVSAIWLEPENTVTITRSVVSQNKAMGDNGDGGGIYLDGGMLTLENSMINHNETALDKVWGDGGAICVDAGETRIAGSEISGNTTYGASADGGAIAIFGGTLALESSTVASNQTMGEQSHGGGIALYGATATVDNSTIHGNATHGTSASGGGVYVFHTNTQLRATSSLMAHNTSAADGGESDCAGPIAASSSHNLLTSTTLACGLADAINSNRIVPSALVGTLTDNGCAVVAGTTDEHYCPRSIALLANSPAEDAGSNPLALPYDQRGAGFPRTIGPVPDIGALEGYKVLLFDDFE